MIILEKLNSSNLQSRQGEHCKTIEVTLSSPGWSLDLFEGTGKKSRHRFSGPGVTGIGAIQQNIILGFSTESLGLSNFSTKRPEPQTRCITFSVARHEFVPWYFGLKSVMFQRQVLGQHVQLTGSQRRMHRTSWSRWSILTRAWRRSHQSHNFKHRKNGTTWGSFQVDLLKEWHKLQCLGWFIYSCLLVDIQYLVVYSYLLHIHWSTCLFIYILIYILYVLIFSMSI